MPVFVISRNPARANSIITTKPMIACAQSVGLGQPAMSDCTAINLMPVPEIDNSGKGIDAKNR
jgi:hypothetical protein